MKKKLSLLLLLSGLALAKDYVFIFTVGDYGSVASSLKGTQRDANSAKIMAQKFGFDSSNVINLRDSQVTKDNIIRKMGEISSSLTSNDRVFIYYSGHGSSGVNPNTNKCESSIYTVEGENLYTSDFNKALRKMNTAKKVFTFFDACHSGDFPSSINAKSTTRTLARASNGFVPKFAKTEGSGCKPSLNLNMKESYVLGKSGHRGLGKSIGNEEMLNNNLILVSASRDDEVSWDSSLGGLATNAVLNCLKNNHQYTDISNLEMVNQLRVCAQGTLDTSFPDEPQKIQHIIVDGTPAPTLNEPSKFLYTAILSDSNRIPMTLNAKKSVQLNENADVFIESPIDGYLSLIDYDLNTKQFTTLVENHPVSQKTRIKSPENIVGTSIGASYLFSVVTPNKIDKLEDFIKHEGGTTSKTALHRGLGLASSSSSLSSKQFAVAYLEVMTH